MTNRPFSLYGNQLKSSDARKAANWQERFIRKFDYDPDEEYVLSLEDNPYLGDVFGLKDIVRHGNGAPIDPETGVIISTIRMGFGHYRIAMAGA